MSVLRNLESKIAGLVEGGFARAFKSEVRPVEIARKLAREMDEHRVASVSRTYVPNEYAVWLSPQDRRHFEGYEDELRAELAGYLLEHARSERVALLTAPRIEFRTDERLRLGEFGIQARLVRPSEDPEAAPPRQGDHGHTMVYSTADRLAEPLAEPHPRRQTAKLRLDGRTTVLGPKGAVLGRSRRADHRRSRVQAPSISGHIASAMPAPMIALPSQDEKNTPRSPCDTRSDWRNASSVRSPSTSASTSGASG